MHRAINWLVGIIIIFALMVLAFLGWLKWLVIGFMIPGGILAGYFAFLVAFRPEVLSQAPTKKTRLIVSSLLFVGMIIALTISVLWALDIIQPTFDENSFYIFHPVWYCRTFGRAYHGISLRSSKTPFWNSDWSKASICTCKKSQRFHIVEIIRLSFFLRLCACWIQI